MWQAHHIVAAQLRLTEELQRRRAHEKEEVKVRVRVRGRVRIRDRGRVARTLLVLVLLWRRTSFSGPPCLLPSQAMLTQGVEVVKNGAARERYRWTQEQP